MNVLPLKQFSYDDWVRIATQNNSLRAKNGLSLWTGDDVWNLWQCFFRVAS